MAFAIIDSVIAKLKSLEKKDYIYFTWEQSEQTTRLMEILECFRTFFLSARIYRSNSCSASLSILEQAIQEACQPLLHSSSLITEEGRSIISDFWKKINPIKVEIKSLYAYLSEGFSEFISSPPVGELMEFLESLENNFRYIQRLNVYLELIEPLLRFLKNFIRFAVLRGVEQKQMENFLIHCQVLGVKIAHLSYRSHLSYMSLFDNTHFFNFHEDIFELVKKIKPVHPWVSETYIQVLKAVKLSRSSVILTAEGDKNILGDFVDSLLGNLWEVLLIDGTSFMESGKYQMQMLYEGLQFLRNILRKQQERFNRLQAHSKDRVGAVITDAGILIFSVYMHQTEEEGSAEEMVQMLFSLLETIEHIKAEVRGTYPVKLTFNFPTANELEFIDLLSENLKELASYKIDSLSSLVQTVQEDLVFLRSHLPNIVEHRYQHEVLQALWSHVMEVAYQAEFVIDSMMVEDMSHSSLKLFNTVAEEIKIVKREALGIDASKYVLDKQKASKTVTHVPLPTSNEDVVGLNDAAEAIADQLIGGSMQLDFISIVGMPGLGKTTLAQRIYHDDSIIHHFHILAWCCISQVYNRKRSLTEILACISPEDAKKHSRLSKDDLAQELYQRLKGRRYLVVLDDVWDIKDWNDLGISFPNDANGSRILLTSRLSDLAFQINPNAKLHPLRRLTDAESLELLQNKLTGKEDFYPALSILGKKIAKNCHGLPLAVVVIAGILATLDQAGWEDVSKRLSHVVSGTKDCTNVLELSYGHLPEFLKPCLLYFGAFPEDEEISTQRLMQLWIAEGFVEMKGQKSPEETAEEYLMALISRSLIMVAKCGSIGGVKTCRVHDLLHEFCVAKAKEESFVQLVRGYNELSDFDVPLRRICIEADRFDVVELWRLFFPRIRTFLFVDEFSDYLNGNGFHINFVFRLKLLRVLDIGNNYMSDTFPDEIFMLIQLRYLALRGHFDSIPSSIEKLFRLETFIVEDSWNKQVLFPDTIWRMQKLRYLRVIGGFVTFVNIESTSFLHNLDIFSTLKIDLGQSMEEVFRKFPNIRKLKCRVLKSDNIWERKKIVEMEFLGRLQSLKLILRKVPLDEIEFHFPSNLKKLTLEKVSSCILSQIGKLESLEVLKLRYFRRDEDNIWEMEEGDFPKLKFLKLEGPINRWTGSGDHLPCLQKLILIQCRKLKELPSCLGCISTLDMIEARHCPKSVASLVQEIVEELRGMGNEDLKVLIDEVNDEDDDKKVDDVDDEDDEKEVDFSHVVDVDDDD